MEQEVKLAIAVMFTIIGIIATFIITLVYLDYKQEKLMLEKGLRWQNPISIPGGYVPINAPLFIPPKP